jgi:hypothetical protein
MLTINNILWAAFGALWKPFVARPQLGLFLFSVVTAVLALLVWKYTSNQRAITRAKDRIKAHFLAMSLFMDSLGVLLGSIARTFGAIFAYLGRQLLPLAIMMVPILPMLVQVDSLYSFAPLTVDTTGKARGSVAQVVVTVDPKVDLTRTPVELRAPAGVIAATRGVRIAFPQTARSAWEDKPVLRSFARLAQRFEADPTPEARWNIVGATPGDYELAVQVGDAQATKSVVVADPKSQDRLYQLARKRHAGGFGDGLGYPGETKLTGPIKSIEIEYPRKPRWWLWIVIYLIETIVIAFALKKPMKVDF